MNREIGFADLELDYLPIAEARRRPGLRLVLGAYAIPGPWREACKGLFDVKGLTYDCVVTANAGASDLDVGMNDSQSELIAWTGQASAPVACWNDERPRASWIDQIHLAERLEPDPPLVPEAIEDRVRMFGVINEIAGENGFGWSKRLLMVKDAYATIPEGDAGRAFWDTLAQKYGYTPEKADAARTRIIAVANLLDGLLAEQRARGSRYLIGDRLSAADIYWACFTALFYPMPPERCPMATAYRAAYSNNDADIDKAITPALREHRDYVYDTHLVVPIVF